MQQLIHIALVMLIAGALGGLVNFFLWEPDQERRLPWWQHAIIGIAASFMVPLFLNMISGDLIDKISGVDGKPGDYSKMFVLAGFCLVAAVSSRAFIRTLSEKVLQEVRNKVEAVDKKVEEAVTNSASAQVQAIAASVDASEARQAIAPFVEDDPLEDSPYELSARTISSEPIALSANEKAVIQAMTGSSFSLRSITGIAKDASLDKATVSAVITSLLSKELIGETIGKSGQPRWFLTKSGRLMRPDS